MESVEEAVRRIIAEHLGIATPDLGADWRDDLGADELDRVEIVVALEERFSIIIEDREEWEARTVADLVELVNRKRETVG